jgi:leucyl/phenylalanyl-tRNA--protein transferase
LNDSLKSGIEFPDPGLANEEGLLCMGGNLHVETLLKAYSEGIFPWYDKDSPILWWSPDPRMILFPNELKISKSLKQVIHSGKFKCKFDTCFEDVIVKCANVPRKNQYGTWITDDMIEAYIQLHKAGFAHSVETFFENKLVGGLYGVSLGGSFFGESMFQTKPDASKLALYHLVNRLTSWHFDLIDAQVPTRHLASLGAKEIPREKFLTLLKYSLKKNTRKGMWTIME